MRKLITWNGGGNRANEESELAGLLNRHIPGFAGKLLRGAVCMYTNTPDGHFLIDHHPDHDDVLIVSPCSGHGFKFASAVGEVAAELVLDGFTATDISPFKLSRFDTN